MTATDSTTRVVSDSGDDIGPGQRLREAREAAKLSVAEVASRMRLEPQVLELLESDHYEHLHGPTFVRGYLSGYARLLDLPERPILEAYERHDHRPPALVSELGAKPEVHVSDFPVRMVTYVIAALLVVLVVLWWQSRQLDTDAPERAEGVGESMQPTPPARATAAESVPAPTPSTPATQPPQAPDAPPPAAPAAAPAQPSAETAQAIAPASQTAAEDTQSATLEPAPTPIPSSNAAPIEASPAPEPAAPPIASPATAEQTTRASANQASANTAPEEATAEPSETAQADDGAAEVGETAAASPAEEQVAPTPPPAPLPGSDRLAIQLTRESWVEIFDRGGGRLYYGLANEGSEIVVEGAGPMRVLLGDVQGAAVAYNGDPFDMTRFKGRSVVRFTVGERSSTTPPQPPAPAAPVEPLTREIAPPAVEQEGAVADAGEPLVVPAPIADSVQQAPPTAPVAPPSEIEFSADQPDS